jgi:DNA-binding NtrC family response regulator
MGTRNERIPPHPILIVDDEVHAVKGFELTLRSGGVNNIIPCSNSLRVYAVLEQEPIEIILLDLVMPDLSGEEILATVNERFPEIPVIMVTGINEVDTAVRCMQKGAFDYVLKPVNKERLLPVVRRAMEVRQLRRENARLTQSFFSESLEYPEKFSRILTLSQKMQAVFHYCEAVAGGGYPILITGETGVGKELIAEAIHGVSGRPGELVAVNVAGLDDNVFSDTLFGHVKGAFTDAVSVRAGQIERAAGGTLFLDEIGDLSLPSQVKLLGLLDKHEYLPLGSDVAKPARVRFLFATHKDLPEMVATGRFREDLLYRLRTHHIHIPPLRERLDDFPILVDFFIDSAAKEFHKNRPAYPPELLMFLQGYSFPGNVRELRSLIHDAVGRNMSKILSLEFFKTALKGRFQGTPSPTPPLSSSIKPWLARLKKFPTIKETTTALVQEAMVQAKNNQRAAALMLGITPQALNQRLKKDR